MKNTIKANETLGVIVHSAQNIKSPELELKATDHFQLQNWMSKHLLRLLSIREFDNPHP